MSPAGDALPGPSATSPGELLAWNSVAVVRLGTSVTPERAVSPLNSLAAPYAARASWETGGREQWLNSCGPHHSGRRGSGVHCTAATGGWPIDLHAGDTLVRRSAELVVGDLSRYYVKSTDVDEYFIGAVKPGRPVWLALDSCDGARLRGSDRVVSQRLQPSATGHSYHLWAFIEPSAG